MSGIMKPFINPIYVTRPLLPEYEKYTQHLKEVWDTHWLSNSGVQHKQLEKQLLNYLKVSHLTLFNNGTTALMVALKALNLSGEVITTPFTFPATSHALTWCNLTPVFCDIDLETMTIDVNKIEAHITEQTTAILGVHVYGIPCDVEAIQQIADRYNLKVLYDAAHAFGIEVNEHSIGEFGDITMFSFHPTKLFHTSEGGALVYNDPELQQPIELLKNFGIKNEFEVILPGINGKMNEMSAIMGQCVLNIIEEEQQKRQKIRELYTKQLKHVDGIKIVSTLDNVKNNQQYFVIRIVEKNFGMSRDVIYNSLKAYNIHTRKYFYPLISDYPHYAHLKSENNQLTNARQVSQEVLCLPFYGELSFSDVTKICDVIKFIKNEKLLKIRLR